MPVRCNRGKPRYRVKTTRTGAKLRLAFCGKRKVVEVKKLNNKR